MSGSGRGEGSGWIRVRVRLSAGVLPPSTTLTRSGRPTEKKKNTSAQRNPLIVDDVDAAAARRPVLRRCAPSPPPSRETRQRGCPRLLTEKEIDPPSSPSGSGDSPQRGCPRLFTAAAPSCIHSSLAHSLTGSDDDKGACAGKGLCAAQRLEEKKYLVPKNKDTMARPLRAAKPREETKCRARKA